MGSTLLSQYHSHHMMGPAARYEKLLRHAGVSHAYRPSTCKMFSSVTGQEMEAENCTPTYWKDNMVSTVLFSPAFLACIGAQSASGAIIEIGSHPALKGPTTEILRSIGRTDVEYFHTCFRRENDFVSLLANVGALIAHGAQLSLAKVNADADPSKAGSPTYKFGSLLTDLPRIRQEFNGSHSTVLRYYPDDELSINTGLISPRKISSRLPAKETSCKFGLAKGFLAGKNHTVCLTAPGEPVILSSRTQSRPLKSGEKRIRVHASVVHPEELRGFLGGGSRNTHEPTRCKFFAGSILPPDQDEDNDRTLRRIVGYTIGSIQRDIVVPESQIYERFDGPLHPLEACCEFAAVAVASCIVDGVARAREGDTFELCLDGVLKVALHRLLTEAGAGVIKATDSTETDFIITYSTAAGVLVNIGLSIYPTTSNRNAVRSS